MIGTMAKVMAAVSGAGILAVCAGAQVPGGAANPGFGSQTPGFAVGMPGGPAGVYQVQSNPRGLLQRAEVQQEIGLDLKQRNALTAMEQEVPNAIRERMRMALQGQDPQFRNMSPQQRQMWMRQQQQLLMQAEAGSQQQGELDEKTKTILTPEQIARLHELDLQKRGPLALGDPRVQEELKLSSQTRFAEAKILGDYLTAMRAIISEAVQAAVVNGDARQGNAPDFTSRLSPLRKKLDANREDAEKRALEALSTDADREAWTNAQGKPFRFRPDPAPPQVRTQQFRNRR